MYVHPHSCHLNFAFENIECSWRAFDLQQKSDMNATDSPVSKPWSDACAHKVLSALQGNDIHVAFDSPASPWPGSDRSQKYNRPPTANQWLNLTKKHAPKMEQSGECWNGCKGSKLMTILKYKRIDIFPLNHLWSSKDYIIAIKLQLRRSFVQVLDNPTSCELKLLPPNPVLVRFNFFSLIHINYN